MQDKIQILNGNDKTTFKANTAITHCNSADAKMSKRFAKTICRRVSGLKNTAEKPKQYYAQLSRTGIQNPTT